MNSRKNLNRCPHRVLNLLLLVALLVSSLSWTATPGEAHAQTAHSAPPPPAPGALVAQADSALKLDALAANQPFIVIFSLPMADTSAEIPLVTYPYLPGKLTWSAKNTVLTFQPDQSFQPGTVYHVYLDSGLKSVDGKTFAKIQQWQIQVKPAPRLVSYTPASSELADRSPVIQLAFNQPMNYTSVENALAIQPAVKYSILWSNGMAKVTFEEPFDPGAHLRVSLSRAATGEDGVALDRDYAWDYWILALKAQASAQNQKEIRVSFNYDLNTKDKALPFAFNPPLKGSWVWINQNEAQFISEEYIPSAQPYTINVTAPLRDQKGTLLPDIDPIPFEPVSPIWRVIPREVGDQGAIDVTTQVTVSFRTPMDHARTEAAFKIDPPMKGAFTWKENDLIFTPGQPLDSQTKYTVTISTSARDAQGGPVLIEPYTWSFVTRETWNNEPPGPVNFGEYGPNAQVIDAESRRALQFSAENGVNTQFSLYRIKPEEFLRFFKTYFGDISYWSGKSVFIPGDALAKMEKVSEWTHKSTSGVQETLIPGDAPLGTYVLAARANGKLSAELLVILTHNTLVVKKSDDRIWVWATKINGGNVPDLYVRLLMQDGSIMREGKTDESGVFATTLPKDVAPFLVVASGEGDDVTVAGMTYRWLSSNYPSDWCCGWDDNQSAHSYGAYLFTDRPIYRPGQTVNFKGIFRADDDARYSLLPEGTQVKVSMLDSRSNVVQSLDLSLNSFGTLNGAFLLADGAMLGDYTLQADVSQRVYKQVFKVQEYRKPDYQVTLSTDKNFYIHGDQVKLDIETRYFFDQPVANAALSVNFFRLSPKYYSSYWWQDIQVGAELPEGATFNWYPSSNQGASLNTGSDGKTSYVFEATANTSGYDYYDGGYCRYSWRSTLRECLIGVEVTASDGSNQTVSASKILKVYSAPEYYTVDAGNWMKKAGEPFRITAHVTGLDGKPVAGRELSVNVKGWDRWDYSRAVLDDTLTTDADGKASLPLSIAAEGSYQIQLTKKGDTQEGSRAGISDWVYVTSSRPAWAQQSWGDFKIAAERSQYKPYETARLVITSSFDGPALLTFERGHVIHTRPIMLTAQLTVIDTQIIPEDAPNVFVKVNAWKVESTKLEPQPEEYYFDASRTNSRLYTSSVELQVDASDKQLIVEVKPEKPYYDPRQEATFAIKVTDAQNQPVEAELSAALVDEAIFSLSEDLSGTIFKAFYGARPLAVDTYNSLALTRILFAGGKGGGGGGDNALPSNPRSNFPDTAAWIPVIKTDQNGKARVSITLPDSLTTWRLTVKAITAGSRVGEATATIVTRQEISLQPALPSGLTAGDTVNLPVVVRNDGVQAREVKLAFKGDGLELMSDSRQTVSLQPGESKRVSWQATAKQSGKVQVVVEALAEVGGDAVQLPLEIRERNLPEVVTESGDLTDEATTVVVLPEAALPGSTVELRLSRSIASDMLAGLEFLTGYPYGCVEQTMSRALPNAVVGRALHQLGIDNPGLEQQLPGLINAGLQRLYGYQHDDGGWGWWFDDQSDDYQTAWVIFGLSTTAIAGYPVDPQVIKRGAEYLQKAIASQEKVIDPRMKAYSLYALAYAGYGDHEAATGMVESAYNLDAFSQAALALALKEQGDADRARMVLNILDSTALVDADKVYWQTGVEDGYYHEKTMASGLRSTALALTAYININPTSDRVPGIVRYLTSQRKGDNWGTTNETAYTILALTDYLLAHQQAEGEAGYTVLLNGQEAGAGEIQPGEKPVKLVLPVDQMKKGPNIVKIQHRGEGHLFYSLTSRMYLDIPKVSAAGTITVKRAYLDPQTNTPLQSVTVGQLVRIQLTVSVPGGYASYLMIEDRLPAGLEALNENLNITAHDTSKYRYNSDWNLEPFYFWQTYGYNNKEIRDGRVTFFVTEFGYRKDSTGTFEYLARANFTGVFSALPAEASAMYDAALWGRSENDTITIQAK